MLDGLRNQIDVIDQDLIQLLNKRFKVVEEIGVVKANHQMPIHDPVREGLLLNQLGHKIGTSPHAPAIKALYESIMASSRAIQSMIHMEQRPMKVAAIGEMGSNSFAALKVLPKELMGITVESFEQAAEMLTEKAVDFALLPIENAITGSIPQVYEILGENQFEVVAEIILPIQHVLAAHHGTTLGTINRVYSHPQALEQCAVFLNQMGVEKSPVASTMHGIPLLKHELGSAAVITTREGAAEFGLDIIADEISKYKENYTRFVLLKMKGRQDVQWDLADAMEVGGARKIAAAMTLKHEKGTLAQALLQIAQLGYNLVKIESRPIPETPFEYQFYIEIAGGTELNACAIQRLEGALTPVVTSFRSLGSYPIFFKKDVDIITN